MSENLDFEKIQLETFLEFSEEISAIAYHKGKIAVALSSSNPRIEIWNYKSNKCDLTIDTSGQEPRYLKFDDNIIMSMFDVIRSWALPSGEIGLEFKGDDTPCYFFDYCSKFNIVVGCFSDLICIWNVSTGEEVKRITEEHGSVQRVFIYPELSYELKNLKMVELLVLKEKEVKMWTLICGPGDMQEKNVKVDKVTTVYPSRNPFRQPVSPKINIFQFKERFLYYFQYSMVFDKIIVWDMMNNSLDNKIEVSRVVKNLLAVGDKYIAFHSEISGINEESFFVIDKETGKEVAAFKLPYELQTIGADRYPAVIMGDTSWLDDLTKENNQHILCICVCMRQIVNVLVLDKRLPEDIKEDDVLKPDPRNTEGIKEGDVLQPDPRNTEDIKEGDVLQPDPRNTEDKKEGDVLQPDNMNPQDTNDNVLKQDERHPEETKVDDVYQQDGCYADAVNDWIGYCNLL